MTSSLQEHTKWLRNVSFLPSSCSRFNLEFGVSIIFELNSFLFVPFPVLMETKLLRVGSFLQPEFTKKPRKIILEMPLETLEKLTEDEGGREEGEIVAEDQRGAEEGEMLEDGEGEEELEDLPEEEGEEGEGEGEVEEGGEDEEGEGEEGGEDEEGEGEGEEKMEDLQEEGEGEREREKMEEEEGSEGEETEKEKDESNHLGSRTSSSPSYSQYVPMYLQNFYAPPALEPSLSTPEHCLLVMGFSSLETEDSLKSLFSKYGRITDFWRLNGNNYGFYSLTSLSSFPKVLYIYTV